MSQQRGEVPREEGGILQEEKMRSSSPADLNPCQLAHSGPRVIFLINQGEKKAGKERIWGTALIASWVES